MVVAVRLTTRGAAPKAATYITQGERTQVSAVNILSIISVHVTQGERTLGVSSVFQVSGFRFQISGFSGEYRKLPTSIISVHVSLL